MRLEIAFGVILQRLRKTRGMTQMELGLNCGLDRTYISLLERGKRQPSLDSIFRLSSTLEVQPSSLVKEVELLFDKYHHNEGE